MKRNPKCDAYFSRGRSRLLLWVCSVAALVLLALPLQAQEFRAVLTGQVSDPSGAVIRDASITVTNVLSGTTYAGRTSDKGVYYIPYVLPGTYTVTATADGFKTAVQDNVLLLASESFNQNFKLEVGAAAERIVVTAAPAELETTTASSNTVIDARTFQALPVNGGQSFTLVGTVPGSQFTQTPNANGLHGTTGWDATNSYTMGGGISQNNQFTLDGANITSQFGYDNHSPGEWTISPNIDAIDEVNVMTYTYDARYGRTSGGTVNVVTKNGTNDYHATARYAYQGSVLDANSYQNNMNGTPRQGTVQNQFWLTAGGPIKKNKLFAFFSFEGYRQALGASQFLHMPPAYLRPGYNGNTGVDFSLVQTLDPSHFPSGLAIFQPGTATCLQPGVAAPQCNSNWVVQTQFPGNAIPSTQINNTATAILKYIPLPNVSGAENYASGNNYLALDPTHYSYNTPAVRVDYNLSDKTKLYSYFLYFSGNQYRSNNGLTGIAANGNINYTHQTFEAVQDATHTFSPTLVGDFKVAFNRFYEVSPDGDVNAVAGPETIGLSMPVPSYATANHLPEFSIGDGWGNNIDNGNTIFGNQVNGDVTNNYTLDADLTKTIGGHNVEFGGEIDEFQYGGRPYSGGHPNGDFSFNSGWTQMNPHTTACYPIVPNGSNLNQCQNNTPNGSGFASFLLGVPGGGAVDWIPPIFEGYPVYAGYVQDNWRVNHRLSVTVGLRYDVQRGLRERHNELNAGLCMTCINPLTSDATYQANIASGANVSAWNAAGINVSSLSTVYGGIQFAGQNGMSRDAYNTDWSDVGPRIGVAYALDPKTVIRGGWGLMYSYGLEGGSSIGYAQTTNYTQSLDNNTPTNYFQTGNPFASGLLKPIGASEGLMTGVGNGTVQVDFPDRKIPKEELLSLGIQRELPGKMVLDAKYAGNWTSRLRVSLWKNGVATLAEQKAAQANPSIWNGQVPNPYYGVAGMSGPGQCGTSTTIEALALMEPGSQYCSPGGLGLIGEYNAGLGHNWYNGLEVKLNRRSSHGLTSQVSYTWSKTINGDGYQNGWPYQDPKQVHWIAGTDRTQVLSVTGVYDLPFGKGELLASNSSPLLDRVIGHWTMSGIFNAQSGTPVGLNGGWWYLCGNQSYKSQKGTSVGNGTWINTNSGCWEQVPTFGLMTTPGNTSEVRTPIMPTLDLSLQKSVPIREKVNFELRVDAFNSLNGVLFGGPDTNPGDGPATFNAHSGWSGFGTIGPNQQNYPRILQITSRLYF